MPELHSSQARIARSASWIGVLGLLALGACGGGLKLAYPDADFPAPGAAANVKMLTPGSGPVIELRYLPTKGDVTERDVRADIEVDSDVGGLSLELSLDQTFEIGAMDNDGIAFTMTIDDFEAEGSGQGVLLAMGLKSALEQAKRTEAQLDMRGRSTVALGSAKLNNAVQGLDTALELGTFVLPEQKVGVGARWVVLEAKAARSGVLRLVTTYEIVQLRGGKGMVKIDQMGLASEQAASVEDGIETTLEKMELQGSGELTFDIGKPFAGMFRFESKMEARIKAAGGGDSQTVDMTTTMKVTRQPDD